MRILSGNKVIAASLVLVAIASCGRSDGQLSEVGELKTADDSLSVALGNRFALQMIEQQSIEENVDSVWKSDFSNGLDAVVESDLTTVEQMNGFNRGVDMATQCADFSRMGIVLQPQIVSSEFCAAVASGVMDQAAYDKARQEYGSIMGRLQHLVSEYLRLQRREEFFREKRIADRNAERGRQYVDKLRKGDSSFSEVVPGLWCKTIKVGGGAHPTETSVVNVVYTLSKIDGTVIDTTEGEAVAIDLSDKAIYAMVKGMPSMAKGGHAVFYVPAQMGFNNPPEGVAPGEMLILDIELK